MPVVNKGDLAELSARVDRVSLGRNKMLDYLMYGIMADNTVTINGYASTLSGDHIIPSTIDGYPVTAIGNGAFGG